MMAPFVEYRKFQNSKLDEQTRMADVEDMM